MKNFFILASILIILALALFYVSNNVQFRTKITEQDKNSDESSGKLICDRDTRLENDPEIDRALSLIYQRLTEFGIDDRLFSPQLVNCVKVETKNIKRETGVEMEGYFDPNNKDIKSNYFPIIIDDWGTFFSDDLTTALLLVHEIAHVEQYIKRYNVSSSGLSSWMLKALGKENKNTCLTDEAFAFKQQMIFMTNLKEEEKKSIDYRMKYDENLNPQLQTLQMIKNSFESFSSGDCEKYDTACIEGVINWHIRSLIENSAIYEKQCSVYD